MYDTAIPERNLGTRPEVVPEAGLPLFAQLTQDLRNRINDSRMLAANIYESINRFKNIRTPDKLEDKKRDAPTTLAEIIEELTDQLRMVNHTLNQSAEGLQNLVGR